MGDAGTPFPFRRHARLWLESDHAAAAKEGKPTLALAGADIRGAVARNYRDEEGRADIEAYESPDKTTKLPPTGMQVHAEYTLYGHFMLLREFAVGAGKVRLFLD